MDALNGFEDVLVNCHDDRHRHLRAYTLATLLVAARYHTNHKAVETILVNVGIEVEEIHALRLLASLRTGVRLVYVDGFDYGRGINILS